MSINLAIKWAHPGAISAVVRYARVDNTTTPVYTTVTPNPTVGPNITTIIVATNVPNGQYAIASTPIYADARTCSETVDYSPACPTLIAINAYISSGNIVVTWTAPAAVPKARITVNFPSGGSSINNYVNASAINTTIIPIPPGNNGDISVFGQSVCDESSGFYSTASNSVTVSNNTGFNPIPGLFITGNTIASICNGSSVELYTNGPFAIGGTLYNDTGLTTPVTGFLYAANMGTNLIYSISSTTGQVLSSTNQGCNVVISNNIGVLNYKINLVTGIPGFSLPGAVPSTGIGLQYTGTRTATIATTSISVNVTAFGGANGSLKLYKNSILAECINVSGDGTYVFGSQTYQVADIIEIAADAGSCA